MSNEATHKISTAARQEKRPAGRWALVPVKTLEHAKQRLASCLGAHRRALTLAMFDDVLHALKDSRCISKVLVVTADEQVADRAVDTGALVIAESEARGLNQAIKLGLEGIRELGGRQVVILPADVPLLTGPELDRVLRGLETERGSGGNSIMGLCASKDGRGTNFLSLDARLPFRARYGQNSFRLHREDALKNERRPVALHSSFLAIDIDRESDLDEFMAFCQAHPSHQHSMTWKFLASHGWAPGA